MVKNNKIEKRVKRVRYVNGIKVYQKAGVWYCDYQFYKDTVEQQGKRASIDGFIRWCEFKDLCPTG